jgi:hypothetical protein
LVYRKIAKAAITLAIYLFGICLLPLIPLPND